MIDIEGFKILEEKHPIDLSRFVDKKDRDIHGFVFKIVNKVGALRELLDVFAKHNINILNLTISKPGFSASSSILVYLDFTDSKITPEKLLEEMKIYSNVEDSIHINPIRKGLVVDTYHFPIEVNSQRVVIFRKPILKRFFQSFKVRFGTVANSFLYFLGFNVGREAYISHSEILGSQDPKGILEMFKSLLMGMSWGYPEISRIDYEKKEITLRVFKLFECEIANEHSVPTSHFLRGVFSGYFTAFFKKRIYTIERKCINMDDDFCEFYLRPIG